MSDRSLGIGPARNVRVRRPSAHRNIQQLNQALDDDLPHHAGGGLQGPARQARVHNFLDDIDNILSETTASVGRGAAGGSNSQRRTNAAAEPVAERPPEYSVTDVYRGAHQYRRRGAQSSASASSLRQMPTAEETEEIRRKEEIAAWWNRQRTLFLKFLQGLAIIFYGFLLALFAVAAIVTVKAFHVYLDSILEGWFEDASMSLPLLHGGRIAGVI